MRLRIFVSSGFLAVLAVFAGFAFDWAISAHREVSYGMPGETVAIAFGFGGKEVSDGGSVHAAGQLREYLAAKALALIIASTGDEFPRLIVADPENALPWLDNTAVNPGDILLFEGSYSHRQWNRVVLVLFYQTGR